MFLSARSLGEGGRKMVIRARGEAAGALGLDVKKRKSNSPPGGVNQGVVACKEKEKEKKPPSSSSDANSGLS